MGLEFDPIEEAAGNWERLGWGATNAMTAATSITRAHQIILGRINDALAPSGLTFSRFEALALLRFARRGALPLGKMGARLQVHPASVTNTVDRLERDGLVRRVAHPTDGRTTLAEITDAGIALVEQAAAALGEIQFGLGAFEATADAPTGRRLSDGDLTAIDSSLWPLRKLAGDF